MDGIINYILTGLILGITAGISPGPLMAVLVSETVKGNIKNGIVISIIPVITDIPLILLTVFILKNFENLNFLFNILYLIGGATLIYFGIKDLFIKKVSLVYQPEKFSSLKKGITTNLVNPHPYIFWIFIGVPFMIQGNIYQMLGFVLSFFTGIVGSKISIALSVDKGKKFIESEKYIYIIRISGFILIIFGLMLFLKIG
jgi:threonine/homoserine/homoserine lactone efflux protein